MKSYSENAIHLGAGHAHFNGLLHEVTSKKRLIGGELFNQETRKIVFCQGNSVLLIDRLSIAKSDPGAKADFAIDKER